MPFLCERQKWSKDERKKNTGWKTSIVRIVELREVAERPVQTKNKIKIFLRGTFLSFAALSRVSKHLVQLVQLVFLYHMHIRLGCSFHSFGRDVPRWKTKQQRYLGNFPSWNGSLCDFSLALQWTMRQNPLEKCGAAGHGGSSSMALYRLPLGTSGLLFHRWSPSIRYFERKNLLFLREVMKSYAQEQQQRNERKKNSNQRRKNRGEICENYFLNK